MPKKPWQLKRTSQCQKCPWKISTDPDTIPHGYSLQKHCNLRATIAKDTNIHQVLRIMACHEQHDAHCLGWLKNQIKDNNITLRVSLLSCTNLDRIQLDGPQHPSFDYTLPEK